MKVLVLALIVLVLVTLFVYLFFKVVGGSEGAEKPRKLPKDARWRSSLRIDTSAPTASQGQWWVVLVSKDREYESKLIASHDPSDQGASFSQEVDAEIMANRLNQSIIRK